MKRRQKLRHLNLEVLEARWTPSVTLIQDDFEAGAPSAAWSNVHATDPLDGVVSGVAHSGNHSYRIHYGFDETEAKLELFDIPRSDEYTVTYWQMYSTGYLQRNLKQAHLFHASGTNSQGSIILSLWGNIDGNTNPDLVELATTFYGGAAENVTGSYVRFPIHAGEWFQTKFYVKFNTPGQANGIYRLWRNDVLVDEQTAVVYRTADDGPDGIWVGGNYSGAGRDPIPFDRYIDDIDITYGSPESGGNHAPILNTAGNPILPVLSPNTESALGSTVQTLIAGAVSDEDQDSQGIAVVGLTTGTSGTWQFAVEGGSWQNFGLTSPGAARLLRDSDRVRFLPGATYTGGASIRYRAWDLTTAAAAETLDLSSPAAVGGNSAFSQEVEKATVSESTQLRLRGGRLTVGGGLASDTFQMSVGESLLLELNGNSYPLDPGVIRSVLFDGKAGRDVATLSGGYAVGEVQLRPGARYCKWTGGGLAIEVLNTEEVSVIGGPDDRARFFGGIGNDTFFAQPSGAELRSGGCAASVSGIGSVWASGLGGRDRVDFYDSPGDDTWKSMPGSSSFFGDGFAIVAAGFQTSYAWATAGGHDVAELRGSAGNDILNCTPESSSLRGFGFNLSANGFADVHAMAGVGWDVAYLSGSAGDDTYTALPMSSSVSGDGFTNTAEGFDAVYANACGGDDSALFFDSPGNDLFWGAGTVARLSGRGYFLQALGFGLVRIDGTSGGMNRKLIHAVDYLFEEIGAWSA